MQHDVIYLTGAADDNAAPGLGIGLSSILERCSGEIRPYLVLDGVSDENLARFKALEDKYGVKIEYVQADRFKGLYRDAKQGSHISYVTYYRLSLQDYLPPEAKKAIWFDSDMLCLGDIRELWNEDLEGNPLGAVYDPVVTEVGAEGIEYKKIGIDLANGYFNAGLLLIDVDQWRAEQVGAQIRAHMQADPQFGRFRDQSRLNKYFEGRWKELSRRYNLQGRVIGLQSIPLKPFDPQAFQQALRDPLIVHFNGPCKPWQRRTLSPFKSDYRAAWRRSPWRNWHHSENMVSEMRWYFGDLRRHWRRLVWLKRHIPKKSAKSDRYLVFEVLQIIVTVGSYLVA